MLTLTTKQKEDITISDETLKALKMGGPRGLPSQAMEVVARQIGVFSTDPYSDWWNQTIDWLDASYPGWRGYYVEYVDGSVG